MSGVDAGRREDRREGGVEEELDDRRDEDPERVRLRLALRRGTGTHEDARLECHGSDVDEGP